MRKSRKGIWLMRGGLLLITVALLWTGFNLWDDWRAGTVVEKVLEEMPAPSEDIGTELPDYLLDPSQEMPEMEIDDNSYIGVLEIPVLGLELPVMSEWSYPKLRTAPCRYAGSAYMNDLVIAAHNYSTHFGQIGKLSEGDLITFTDLNGNIFHYTVTEVGIVKPESVQELTDSGWALTLFTCTIGGQSRVVVRCM